MSAESPQPDFENTYSGSKNNEEEQPQDTSASSGSPILNRRRFAGGLAGAAAAFSMNRTLAAFKGHQSERPLEVAADATSEASADAGHAIDRIGDSESTIKLGTEATIEQENRFEFVEQRVEALPTTDVQWIHDAETPPGTPREQLAPQEHGLRYEVNGHGFVQIIYEDPEGKYQADAIIFFLTAKDRTANRGILVPAPGGRLDLSQDLELQTLFKDGYYQGDTVRAVVSAKQLDYKGRDEVVALATSDPVVENPGAVVNVDLNMLRGESSPTSDATEAPTATPSQFIERRPIVGRVPDGEQFDAQDVGSQTTSLTGGVVEAGLGAGIGAAAADGIQKIQSGWQAKPEQYISKSDGQDGYPGGDKVAVGLMESGQQEITNDEQQPEFKQEVSPMRAAAIEIKHAVPTSVENEQAEGADSPIGPVEDLSGLQDLVAQYNAERAPLQSRTGAGVRMSPEPSTPEVRPVERDPNWPEPEVMDPKYQA